MAWKGAGRRATLNSIVTARSEQVESSSDFELTSFDPVVLIERAVKRAASLKRVREEALPALSLSRAMGFPFIRAQVRMKYQGKLHTMATLAMDEDSAMDAAALVENILFVYSDAADQKHWEQLFELARARSLPVGVDVVRNHIRICGHRKNLADAIATFTLAVDAYGAHSFKLYEALIGACFSSGDVAAGLAYLAQRLALDTPVSPIFVEICTRYLQKQGSANEMIAFLERVCPEPAAMSPVVLARFVSALATSGEEEKALALIRNSDKLKDPAHMSASLESFADLRAEGALFIFQRYLRESNYTSVELASQLAKAYYHCGSFDKIAALFDDLKSVTEPEAALAALHEPVISSLVHLNRFDEAKKLFDFAVKEKSLDAYTRDLISLCLKEQSSEWIAMNSLQTIHQLSRKLVSHLAGKPLSESLAIVQKFMEENNYTPRTVYNAWLQLNIFRNNFAQALLVLEEMLGAGIPFPQSSLMRLFSRAKSTAELDAIELAVEMLIKSNAPPEPLLFEAAIVNLSRFDRTSKFDDYIGFMRHNGLFFTDAVCAAYAKYLYQSSRPVDCIRFLDEMLASNVHFGPQTWSLWLASCIRELRSDRVASIWEKMRENHFVPDLSFYHTALNRCYRANDAHSFTFIVYDLMSSGIEETVDTESIIAKGLFKFGRIDDVVSIWDSLHARQVPMTEDWYLLLIRGFLQHKKFDLLKRAKFELEKLRSLTAQAESVEPKLT